MASVFKRGGKANRNGKWYVQWFDHNGKRRSRCSGTTDKATAERIAKKLEADAALRRDGVIDPALDAIGRESHRSIESHLTDFENKLQASRRTEKHIRSTLQFIRWVCEHAGFQVAADISADGVNRYVSKLRNEGRAARTEQSHLAAIKQFTKWLCEHHKLPRDPLASVEKPDPKADRRRERRMLLPEEWHRLELATQAGPDRYRMTGPERCLLYQTALQTGLRSNELRSLTRGRLYLDSNPPYITCKAGSTKNRKDARQYIQPELAHDLKAHIARKAIKTPVFNLPHETNVARMLRDDLSSARAQWLKEAIKEPDEYAHREQSDFLADTNHDGEMFDFHCLRHTTGAWLSMTGAHPKVVQTVMRHSTITLTMDTYGHLFPGQEADAIGRLQSMLTKPTPTPALQATGTEDFQPESAQHSAQQLAQHSGRETVPDDANVRREKKLKPAQEKTPKSLKIADLGEVVQGNARSSGGGTRTPDTRIMMTRVVVATC